VVPRIWLWPNLLSLDAPLVAVLWQILFIRCFHADGNTSSPVSSSPLPSVLLVSAVWLIYSADRALDAWRGSDLRPRHEFYRRHWRAILPVWTIVLSAASWLAWTHLQRQTFERGAWLAAAVGVYFAAVHVSHRKWPKEAAVAVIFALGASLAAWTRVETRADVLTVIVFSCLCWINCVAIERWEHNLGEHNPEPHGPSPYPLGVLAACLGLAAILILHHQRPILAGAEASSAAAFVLLDRAHLKFSADALRVLADAALLSPIFFLPLAGTGF
jgi:hypothetical protein